MAETPVAQEAAAVEQPTVEQAAPEAEQAPAEVVAEAPAEETPQV